VSLPQERSTAEQVFYTWVARSRSGPPRSLRQLWINFHKLSSSSSSSSSSLGPTGCRSARTTRGEAGLRDSDSDMSPALKEGVP